MAIIIVLTTSRAIEWGRIENITDPLPIFFLWDPPVTFLFLGSILSPQDLKWNSANGQIIWVSVTHPHREFRMTFFL